MAKINIQEVSGEVSLKEMSRENRRNHEVAGKDPLWDNWYEVAEKYEPKTIIKEDDEPANSKRSAKKKRVSAKAKVRRQRRATRAKKAEIQRNAIEIVKNFSKRMEEDQKIVLPRMAEHHIAKGAADQMCLNRNLRWSRLHVS